MQLLQIFGTPFWTYVVYLTHLTLSGGTLNHTFSKQLSVGYLLAANPSLKHL